MHHTMIGYISCYKQILRSEPDTESTCDPTYTTVKIGRISKDSV